MSQNYKRLSQPERIQIEKMIALNYSISKIALVLNRNKSTISRELKNYPKKQYNAYLAQHKLFTKNTKVQVYFTHPYSPWQRPTNENTNGLLRDYFPKGTDLSIYSEAQLKKVQRELNERPRKVLDMLAPCEVFKQMILEKIEV